MSNYSRVIPRDLFNEAKLLKCLGVLSLKIHDNLKRIAEKINLVHEDEKSGFNIIQTEDGSLTVANLYLFDNSGTPIYLTTPINSKLNYPLLFEIDADVTEFVFNDDGEFSDEFLKAITIIK